MKSRSVPRIAIALALMVSVPHFSRAKPGGTYRGSASNSVLAISGLTPLSFGTIPVQIRIPNNKGKIRGTLFTTQIQPAALASPADVPISGRIKKAVSRQGGKKHLLKGQWIWDTPSSGLPVASPANGRVRLLVKKSGRKYVLKPLPGSAAAVLSAGPPPYSFTATISATK